MDPFLSALRLNQPCGQLEFGLVTSRTAKQTLLLFKPTSPSESTGNWFQETSLSADSQIRRCPSSLYKMICLARQVAHTCNPSYSGGKTRRIVVQSQTKQIVLRPYLKKAITKKGWWSSSRWRSWIQIPVPHTHTHTHKHTNVMLACKLHIIIYTLKYSRLPTLNTIIYISCK
jgi:hypothetical protein